MGHGSTKRLQNEWEQSTAARLKALASGEDDLDDARRRRIGDLAHVTSDALRRAKDRLARTQRFLDLTQPIVAGMYWPRDNPTMPWEAFRILVSQLTAADYQALAALRFDATELSEDNFTSICRVDPAVFDDQPRTGNLFALVRWMEANLLYPAAMTPLHSRFVADVAVTLVRGVAAAEHRQLAEAETSFAQRFAAA
jgi:hypothetical protein